MNNIKPSLCKEPENTQNHLRLFREILENPSNPWVNLNRKLNPHVTNPLKYSNNPLWQPQATDYQQSKYFPLNINKFSNKNKYEINT